MKLFKKKPELVKEVVAAPVPAPKSTNAETKALSVTGKPLLGWIYQPSLVALALLVLAGVAIEFTLLKPLDAQQLLQVKNIVAASVKNNVDGYIGRRQKELLTLARTDVIRNTLESQTDAQDLNKLLATMFEDFDRLYVVPVAELQQVDGRIKAELSFAGLDILRRVAAGKPVVAEAFYHNDAWRFQVAAAVKSETGELLGAILGIYNVSALKPLLVLPAGMPAGELSLLNVNGNEEKNIIRVGAGNIDEAVTVNTAIVQWQVRYAPELQQLPKVDRMVIWVVLGVTGLLLAALIFWLCRVNLTRLRNDLISATQVLKGVLSGDSRAPKGLLFSETWSLVTAVSQSAKESLKPFANTRSSTNQTVKAIQDTGAAPLFDDDLLDLDVLADLESGRNTKKKTRSNAENDDEMVTEVERLDLDVPQSIFRAYDIRGVVNDTLNEGIVELIGKALASEALAQGQNTLCVGYDGRLSNTLYCEALTKGILSTGVNAIIIGQVPTPLLYFATHHFGTGSGVMITGSHNPSNYNGFKMMLGGVTLSGDTIQKLYNRILLQDFAKGQGSRRNETIDRDYLDTILNDIAVAAPLKVVVDAGNGVAGGLAPTLIEELGCEVIPLYCEVDGHFPNHHPDPGKPENLQDLIAAVKEHEADIGLAFDGDGDRIGVVTNEGKIIWPDRLLMLFAKDVVSRNPGADIIFDVKCSRRLNGLISGYGGRPIMWKTGHSLIKAKMKETGALLAGEMSGHVFFKERWFGFDDGLYTAARLLEILGVEDRCSDEVFADFPEDISTPELNVQVTDESKFLIVEKLCALKDRFTGGNVSTIDGLRVDFQNGWGLCRASNTTPVLVLRFEADDEASLEEIKDKFKAQLRVVEPDLDLSF